MPFIIRQLNNHQCLGDKLKALRKGANFNLDQMTEKTKVQKTYLKWIEAGMYEKLPDPIYTRNFLKAYLRALKTDDTYYLDLFEQEHGTCDFMKQARLPRQRTKLARFLIGSQICQIGFFALITISLIFYFGLEIRHIVAPPKIAIFSPSDGVMTNAATLTVSGHAEQGTHVRINGIDALLTKEGDFKKDIALQRGLNVIKIEGAKRYSHTAVSYRRVVLEEAKEISLGTWTR